MSEVIGALLFWAKTTAILIVFHCLGALEWPTVPLCLTAAFIVSVLTFVLTLKDNLGS